MENTSNVSSDNIKNNTYNLKDNNKKISNGSSQNNKNNLKLQNETNDENNSNEKEVVKKPTVHKRSFVSKLNLFIAIFCLFFFVAMNTVFYFLENQPLRSYKKALKASETPKTE